MNVADSRNGYSGSKQSQNAQNPTNAKTTMSLYLRNPYNRRFEEVTWNNSPNSTIVIIMDNKTRSNHANATHNCAAR